MEELYENWNGYVIKRVDSTQIDSLVEISVSAFGIRPSHDYYLNKNTTHKWGTSYLGFIAYDVNTMRPAAFYGVYACEVLYDGVQYLAAQSGDTMTHKDHGGKGLFVKLATKTYELCRDVGVRFVFGFPNYNSYPGFVKKLNWICPGNLSEYRFSIPTFPLVKIEKKFPMFSFLSSGWRSIINMFYRVEDVFFENSVLEQGVGGVKRDKDFIKYKQKVGGSYFVKVGGSRVWLKADGFLIIGDIEIVEKFKVKEFVGKLKWYAFLIGADVVLFQTTPESRIDRCLKFDFTPTKAFPFGYCKLDSELDPSKFKYNMCDVDTF